MLTKMGKFLLHLFVAYIFVATIYARSHKATEEDEHLADHVEKVAEEDVLSASDGEPGACFCRASAGCPCTDGCKCLRTSDNRIAKLVRCSCKETSAIGPKGGKCERFIPIDEDGNESEERQWENPLQQDSLARQLAFLVRSMDRKKRSTHDETVDTGAKCFCKESIGCGCNDDGDGKCTCLKTSENRMVKAKVCPCESDASEMCRCLVQIDENGNESEERFWSNSDERFWGALLKGLGGIVKGLIGRKKREVASETDCYCRELANCPCGHDGSCTCLRTERGFVRSQPCPCEGDASKECSCLVSINANGLEIEERAWYDESERRFLADLIGKLIGKGVKKLLGKRSAHENNAECYCNEKAGCSCAGPDACECVKTGKGKYVKNQECPCEDDASKACMCMVSIDADGNETEERAWISSSEKRFLAGLLKRLWGKLKGVVGGFLKRGKRDVHPETMSADCYCNEEAGCLCGDENSACECVKTNKGKYVKHRECPCEEDASKKCLCMLSIDANGNEVEERAWQSQSEQRFLGNLLKGLWRKLKSWIGFGKKRGKRDTHSSELFDKDEATCFCKPWLGCDCIGEETTCTCFTTKTGTIIKSKDCPCEEDSRQLCKCFTEIDENGGEKEERFWEDTDELRWASYYAFTDDSSFGYAGEDKDEY